MISSSRIGVATSTRLRVFLVIKSQISMMFDKMLADNCQARELDSDGEYTLVSDGKEPLNSQELFYDLAYERASKAEVEDK